MDDQSSSFRALDELQAKFEAKDRIREEREDKTKKAINKIVAIPAIVLGTGDRLSKKFEDVNQLMDNVEKLVRDHEVGAVIQEPNQDTQPSIQGNTQDVPIKYTSLIDAPDSEMYKDLGIDILSPGFQGANRSNKILSSSDVLVPIANPLIAEGDQLVADPTTGAVKADGNKVLLQLLPLRAIRGVGIVMTHGAHKYSSNNWRGGFKYTRLIGASMRHLFAWMSGEDKDPDSGECHISHAATNLLFLSEMIITNTGEDDRYVYPPKDSS